MTDILATIASVPFAVAVTALLRRRWPSIDGAYVYAVVLAMTILAAVAAHYRAQIPAEVWIAAAPVIAAILALGGVQTAQHVAQGGAHRVTIVDAGFPDREAVTVQDRPTVPPEKP